MARDPSETIVPEHVAASRDLTALYQAGKPSQTSAYDGIQQYEPVFQSLARALYGDGNSHAVLTAERGVDPEMFISEFARLAASGWMPYLRERRVVLVDARHTTPDESRDRMLAILASLAPHREVVACISGFGSLLRSSHADNGGVLLSALDSVACKLVVIMSPNAYEELLSGDFELEERFARVDLPEPSPEAAASIVRQYAQAQQERYQVAVGDEIVRMATALSANYVLHERLPGKARKILHRICQDCEFERTQLGGDRTEVTVDDVFSEVARVSGVPVETLQGIAEKRDYETSLREFIVGQDHVVKEVAMELGLIKAGLVDSGKPASVIMFVGQTGTGKTEMAKALARFYSNTKRLRTYTLGNMVESHSVSSIIGVPPGYVGHDRGGKIVQDLNSDPHCVFLLDEVDKAHPDVLQPFLNLFDEGWIRDQRGVQAYANKAIFILTTNVGQRMIADMAKQGKSPDEMATRMKDTLAQIKHAKLNRPVFAPEFLARLKRVIVFQPLSREAMLGISSKLIREMQQHWLVHRDRTLVVDDRLVQSIGEEAHHRNDKSDGKEGGRVVRKLLSDFVESNLQRAISDQPHLYSSAGQVRVVAEPQQGAGTQDSTESNYLRPDELKIRVEFLPNG